MVERMLRPQALNKRSYGHICIRGTTGRYLIQCFTYAIQSFGFTCTSYPPSADAGLSGSQRSGTAPGSPPLWWSRTEWAHNTHTDHSPPTHIHTHRGLMWGTELHTTLFLARSLCIWLEGYFQHLHNVVYLAGEHGLDHLCVLTGEHGAGQAEDHTHCRQQHEQWHLWRSTEPRCVWSRMFKCVTHSSRWKKSVNLLLFPLMASSTS